MKTAFSTVDDYIRTFPEDVQSRLKTMRDLIKKLVPDAEEQIAYGMPAYKTFKKPLVYFAAFKSHIGFYATPTGHEAFKKGLSVYKQGKGSVQFPLDEPLPSELISKIISFRVKENEAKAKKK